VSARAAVLAAVLAVPAAAADLPSAGGLTAVAGIQVGQHTLSERPTGCTVVLAPAGAVAGVDVRGGAPGTIGTDLLEPTASDTRLHAIVLSGGSAFGLDAAAGVMRFLEERGVGFETRAGRVPIVAGAILFDLGVGTGSAKPTADCGYRAASAANAGPVAEGSVGAGAGATVGKLGPIDRAMKAGVGTASITVPGGVTVAALVAVNALGDVVDPDTGRIVAGTRTPGGTFADARLLLRAGRLPWAPPSAENTTLAVVATDAALSKAEATKVARMAHDGLARAIVPVHTPRDGDTVFALATGARRGQADVTLVGSLAADAVAQAVVRAVRQATGVAGFPAVRDLPAR
jgi:L-aminopeptidase/D-esterase-like protein